jgi:hypothetical protein
VTLELPRSGRWIVDGDRVDALDLPDALTHALGHRRQAADGCQEQCGLNQCNKIFHMKFPFMRWYPVSLSATISVCGSFHF